MMHARQTPSLRRGLRALRLAGAIGAALCVFRATGVAAAPPAAGTAIPNVAQGTYVFTGVPFTMGSNAVVTVVQPLEACSLARDTTATLAPGATFTFRHRLTNLGNAMLNAHCLLANDPGDDFDAGALALAIDQDGDGTLSAGDVILPPGAICAVGVGATTNLLVVGQVPPGAPPNGRARLRITCLGSDGSTVMAENVDTLVVPVLVPEPRVRFFAAADYAREIREGRGGQPLFLQVDAPGWDRDPAVADTVRVTLRTQRATDDETFLAVETGPSTGVFRVAPDVPTSSTAPPAGPSSSPAVAGDRIVTAARGDVLLATAVPIALPGARGAIVAHTTLWMDASSYAFDAASDLGLAGVTVALVDVTGQGNGGAPGGPARVLDVDGLTPLAATVTTDAAGAFSFPLVPRSTYRFDVVPGAGRRFPSSAPAAALPADRLVDVAGSYGAPFAVADTLAPLAIDLPVDAGGEDLFVEKTASSPDVELGETVDYTVRVVNRGGATLDSTLLEDRLPAGFAYVPGSARLDGARLADPAGGGGPLLAFMIDALAPATPRVIRYRARVGAGARDGDGVNRAWAVHGATQSNVASAKVRLVGGVFAEEATVLGTVFVDVNGDGRLDPGDVGLPGVRLWLDDGSFAVTDADGRYSLYGLAPRTHALKVDPVTLPDGARAVPTDARNGGRAGLAFVDATLGDFVRSDWAVTGGTDSALVRAARARAGSPTSPMPDELAREVALGAAPLEARHGEPDARGLPASAITTGESRLPLFAPGPAAPGAAPPAAAPADSDTTARFAALGPALGFVDFADTDTVAAPQVRVRVKGPLGATPHLSVNGTEVAAERVGKRVEATAAGVELWEFVGVALVPGPNALLLTADLAGSGDHPAPARVTLVAPDRPGRIEIDAPRAVPADGFTPARITLRVVDPRGVPVSSRTLVTLESSLGRLVGDDLDPVQGGLQIAVEGGHATVSLFAQGSPGVAEVRATCGALEGSARIAFVPDLRPFLAVGALEGTVGLSHRIEGRGGSVLAQPGPAFESPATTFASVGKDGDQFATLHGALFLKGRIRDDVLLTVGYDSDRPKDLRRLRDIQPDAFDPIYGDASVKGYEARSTENLYARLDRRGASLLFGDYDTPSAGPGSGRSLAAYSRSLSGLAGGYENHRLRVDSWTSKNHTRRTVDEIRGRGVSGPYRTSVAPLVENTEKVEIVVRDRDQPAIVRSIAARQRFVDYEIDPLTGELLLKAPVPSVDADLNPVFLRITYETDSGGDPFWVTGLSARGRVTRALELGASYVDDHDPAGFAQLRSVFAAAKLSPTSTLEAELAGTRTAAHGADEAARFEWRRTSRGVEARVYGASTGAHFDNASSGFAAGRAEAGARVTLALSPRSRLLVDGLYTAVAGGHDRQGGLLLALDRRLNSTWRAEIGTRLAGSVGAGTGAGADTSHAPFAAALRAKATAQIPGRAGTSAYAEFEQDTRQVGRRLLAVGAESRVLARGRLYMRHEILSSFVGPFAQDDAQRQHTTVFGMDANVTPDARVFSEYRADGLFGAREGEAAVGLSNAWRLASGARVNATLERVQPLGDVANATPAVAGAIASPGASTAVTLAVDYATDPRWKGSARSEFRTGRTGDGMLTTLAGAVRLGARWSALARSSFSVNDDPTGLFTLRERAQLGFAYRPGAGWDAVGRYELHYDGASGGGAASAGAAPSAVGVGAFASAPTSDGRKLVHVVSVHTTGPLGDRATGAFAWAGKLAWDGTGGVSSFTTAHWVHGRAAWAVGRTWNAGVTTGIIAATASRRGGAGLEIGRRLDTDAWLSLGYNVVGYADDDLTGEEWTRHGAYLRIRARFDESLWNGRRP